MTELKFALAVEDDSTSVTDEALTDMDILISVCAGIVTVDKGSGIIRLVHVTVQKYLESPESKLPYGQIDIARTCVTYLGFDVFNDPCVDEDSLEKRLKECELSRYAAQYWADHARGIAESKIHPDVFRAFISPGKRESMGQIQMYVNSKWRPFEKSIGNSLLHIIAENGLGLICQLLLNGQFEDRYRYVRCFQR